MSGDLRILAFDTSGPWCAAALLIGNRVVAARHEETAKGQAERLMPMLDEVLAEEGAVWEELDAVGVGVGPGNFTGIRISVSAARGLALGLGIPAIGVSGFDVVRQVLNAGTGRSMVLLPAPRDQVYWEHTGDGVATAFGAASRAEFVCHTYLEPPAVIRLADDLVALDPYPVGGTEIDCDAPGTELPDFAAKVAPAIAAVASSRLIEGGGSHRPSPLYIRAADAAPASDPPPVILP